VVWHLLGEDAHRVPEKSTGFGIISLILARAWEETYRTDKPAVEINPYTTIS
jgi:hypothetical protein